MRDPTPDPEPVRDGMESLPEMLDLGQEMPAFGKSRTAPEQGEAPVGQSSPAEKAEEDDLVTEALLESFPASDPPASARMTAIPEK